MTVSFIPSCRSAFRPASIYSELSDTYFTWKTKAFCGRAFSLTDCALNRAGNSPSRNHPHRTRRVSDTAESRMLASSAVLVAVVAGRRSVHEVRYAGVLVDGYRLRMGGGGVAVDARKTGIVCGHLVAVVA